MDDCTCILDGLCWYHQCECVVDGEGGVRNPDCYYHNELERVGADSSYEYGEMTGLR